MCHALCTVHIKNEISFGTALQCYHLRHSAEYSVFLDTFSTCFKQFAVGRFISRPAFAAVFFPPFIFFLSTQNRTRSIRFCLILFFCLFSPWNCTHEEKTEINVRKTPYTIWKWENNIKESEKNNKYTKNVCVFL